MSDKTNDNRLAMLTADAPDWIFEAVEKASMNPETTSQTNPGFYWVRWGAKNEWTIAQFDGDYWWLTGSDDEAEVPPIIGPRLVPPGDAA